MAFSSGKGKKFIIAALIVLVGVALYSLSVGITGFITVSNIKTKLTITEQELNSTQLALSNAQESVKSAEAAIENCQKE